jgi:RimJ/RimL family protein N-acetyltransferase
MWKNSAMTIPILTTSRLILRGPALADFPGHAADRADPRVMRYMGKGDLLDEEEAFKGFLSMAGHWAVMGYGTWTVEEKATATRIGAVGFADKKRPSEHPASGAPEMGWSFAAHAHGKGYATEAVNAALDWARDFFGAGARTVCVISTDNAASIRVAQKAGFKRFATATRYGLGRLVFERML